MFTNSDNRYDAYVNPYEAYGHHTGYGIEETESYARVHNAPNAKAETETK